MGNVCTHDSAEDENLRATKYNMTRKGSAAEDGDTLNKGFSKDRSEKKRVNFQSGPIGITFNGRMVVNVTADSQADKAGVSYGWKVIEVNGLIQPNCTSAIDRAIEKEKHDVFEILFQKAWTKEVTFSSDSIGITYTDTIVTEVTPDSEADKAGVKTEWVIVSVNDIRNNLTESRINQAIQENTNSGEPNVIVFYKAKEDEERTKKETMRKANAFLSNYKVDLANAKWSLEDKAISDSDCLLIAHILCTDTSIQELNLRGNDITDTGAIALGHSLKSNSTLTELILNENDISCYGAEALASGLEVNRGMKRLLLFNTGIGDSGLIAFGSALKVNSSLVRLYLKNSKVSDEGIKDFMENLKINSTLTQLWLQSSQIGDSGGTAIGGCLEENSTLTLLSLKSNSIGDEGTQVIAEGLTKNTVLTLLSIAENNICDVGAEAIGKALKANSFLKELFLNRNKIGDDGAVSIADGLKNHPTIISLDILAWNKIGIRGESALNEAKLEHETWKTFR